MDNLEPDRALRVLIPDKSADSECGPGTRIANSRAVSVRVFSRIFADSDRAAKPPEWEDLALSRYPEFRRLARESIGIDFPEEYVSSSRVRALVDGEGRILGGYLIRSEGPFRTLLSIPEGATLDFPENFHSEMAEINALFLLEGRRSGAAMVSLLRDLVERLHEAGFRYGVFSVELDSLALLSCYRRSGSRSLYSGETRKLPGMTSSARETIEYFDVPALVPRIRARYVRERSHRRKLKTYHEASRFTKSTRRSV